ncbi:MAG: apolipoprotein N-acyltransferase [Elusimicrobiota bacterium]|nr:apolipoprotein N-acyltransferase [Elusimicrobiota bacterium]
MLFPVLLCLVSGAVYSSAFPPADAGFTAWFAFIPFFFACAGKSIKQKLLLGFIAGISAFSLNLYWLYPTVRCTGESALLSFSAVILAGAFFAIFAALWALFSESKSVYAAASGVLLSWLGTKILWSVPWCPLYVSQASYPAMIQICSLAGPYFLTFLIIYANHSFYRALSARRFRPLIPALALVSAVLFYGFYRLSVPLSGDSRKICVVQPNIGQIIKWDREEVDVIKEKIKFFTVTSFSADLRVFPEAVLPGILNYDADINSFVDEMENIKKTPAVMGAAVYMTEKNRKDGARRVLKNSAMLLNGNNDGSAVARQFYFKRKLVPFGEFVPFGKFLGRFIKVINTLGGFERGQKAEILKAGELRIIPLICSESVYPCLWRGNGNIAVNITNDAWFGKTAAARQHLRHVIVGAVSFGVPAVFANNTGPSALIDSRGRVVYRSSFSEECSFTRKAAVPACGSFYGRHFDITLAASFVIAAYALLMIVRRRFLNG